MTTRCWLQYHLRSRSVQRHPQNRHVLIGTFRYRSHLSPCAAFPDHQPTLLFRTEQVYILYASRTMSCPLHPPSQRNTPITRRQTPSQAFSPNHDPTPHLLLGGPRLATGRAGCRWCARVDWCARLAERPQRRLRLMGGPDPVLRKTLQHALGGFGLRQADDLHEDTAVRFQDSPKVQLGGNCAEPVADPFGLLPSAPLKRDSRGAGAPVPSRPGRSPTSVRSPPPAREYPR